MITLPWLVYIVLAAMTIGKYLGDQIDETGSGFRISLGAIMWALILGLLSPIVVPLYWCMPLKPDDRKTGI